GDDLLAADHTVLDELDEARAGLRGEGQRGRGGEGVLVGAGGDGALRRDHAHAVVAGRGDGAAHGRLDHLDDGDVVAFAGVAQHGGGGGVAGDDEHLHTVVDQTIH